MASATEGMQTTEHKLEMRQSKRTNGWLVKQPNKHDAYLLAHLPQDEKTQRQGQILRGPGSSPMGSSLMSR